MRIQTLNATEIIYLLTKEGYSTRLTWDYDTKQALLDGHVVKLKKLRFQIAVSAEVNMKQFDFNDAVYYLATENTPQPVDELSDLGCLIALYLTDKDRVTVPEILDKVLQCKPFSVTNKQLQMKITKELKQLGWIKHRSGNTKYWALPNV